MKSLFSTFSLSFALGAVGFSAAVLVLTPGPLHDLGALQAANSHPLSMAAGPTKEEHDAFLADGTKALLLLPSRDNQYDFSVQVEGLAKQKGATLTSLALSPDSGKAAPGKSPVPGGSTAKRVIATISVSGTYDQVGAFVTGLTSLERFVTLDQVTVSSAVGAVSAQVTAFAYYLP